MRTLRVALYVCLASVLTLPLAASQAGSQAARWDINVPVWPTTRIEFDTNEGTWMNVDVSPDGLWNIWTMQTDGSDCAVTSMVMLNGRLLDGSLNDVGSTTKRPPFWFEGR